MGSCQWKLFEPSSTVLDFRDINSAAFRALLLHGRRSGAQNYTVMKKPPRSFPYHRCGRTAFYYVTLYHALIIISHRRKSFPYRFINIIDLTVIMSIPCHHIIDRKTHGFHMLIMSTVRPSVVVVIWTWRYMMWNNLHDVQVMNYSPTLLINIEGSYYSWNSKKSL